nr:C_GCAxxG_C_C family protein [Bacteroidota bacterium]
MENAVEKSKVYFDSGFGCAESVLKATMESKGIESELIPRIASGFCGGIANTGGMCGAVIGAIMALNIAYGRNMASESKELNDQKVRQFIGNFESKFGSSSCPALTGCDLGTEAGQQKFNKLNLHQKCAEFTGEATRMVLGMM